MRGHRGFTLIEMVVALAIVALIAVVLFEGLRFGQRAHEKVIDRGGASWQVFASQRLIRSLLESAYPREPTASETAPTYGLEGDPEKVSLLAAAPLAAGGVGLQRYDIEPRRNQRGMTDVIVRWRSDLATAEHAAEEVLIEDVVAVRWRYQGEDSAVESSWLDHWHARQQLPRLVRLQIRFAANDPRRWPELVITPRITDDANCRFDVVAQRCRSGS
jgi:general secretion pathway protein J